MSSHNYEYKNSKYALGITELYWDRRHGEYDMNEFIKIKLEIANRLYPLTIKPEQEEGLRKSALRIDQMIKKFEKNYEVRDKQDVLAMCALQFASIAEKNSEKNINPLSNELDKVVELINLIDVHLETY